MKIVRHGRWLYDDLIYKPVDVISLNFDFWYEIGAADDQLEPDEVPTPMNSKGVLYYYRYRKAGERTLPTWPDSPGFVELEDAMRAAQESLPSPIEWA